MEKDAESQSSRDERRNEAWYYVADLTVPRSVYLLVVLYLQTKYRRKLAKKAYNHQRKVTAVNKKEAKAKIKKAVTAENGTQTTPVELPLFIFNNKLINMHNKLRAN